MNFYYFWENKKVLVHCFIGSSRCASIVVAYLIWKNQLEYSEAAKFLRK